MPGLPSRRTSKPCPERIFHADGLIENILVLFPVEVCRQQELPRRGHFDLDFVQVREVFFEHIPDGGVLLHFQQRLEAQLVFIEAFAAVQAEEA